MSSTSIADLSNTVTYVYSLGTPVVHEPSRPVGWRVFDYDGTRPCVPASVMRELAARLAGQPL